MRNSLTKWFSRSRIFIVFGIGVLACVVFIIYFPAVSASLYADDWGHLERAGRATWSEYLTFYFDPRVQGMWYRPAQGILIRLTYVLFDSNAAGYHITPILLHIVNCLFLLAIVRRISSNWRLAFVSALIYAILPVYSWAVVWFAVVDPQAVLFYLWAIWAWVAYLQDGARLYRVLAFVAFICSLMSKETGATLPLVLAVMDMFFFQGRIRDNRFLLRYTAFAIVLLPYLILQWYIQSRGWFARDAGYSLGPHMVENLIRYSEALFFPGIGDAWNHFLLVITIPLLSGLIVWTRNPALVFLLFFAFLNILPVIGFAPSYFQSRFLYLSATAIVVFWAWLLEWIHVRLGRWQWHGVLLSGTLIFGVVGSGLGIIDTVTTYAERSRQERVPFRDIAQRHPTFPPGTYLYFIGSHDFYLQGLSGMLFWRYGYDVTVGSTNDTMPARLHDHPLTFVYYFGETRQPIDVSLGENEPLQTPLPLPVSFAEPIRLEGYETTRTQIKRGETLVILLYWRTQERIATDYTVFAHLVHANGETVAGYDSQPKQGTAPTTIWPRGRLMIDSIIMPIPSDVPAGTDYRLELGLYYLPSMERLGIVDAAGHVIADSLIIEPFKIVE
jgi:hypothetical protein